MSFYEKTLTKENKKLFVKENKALVEELLSDFFSRTVLADSKTKLANQVITAYLENKKGKEFIDALLSPRVVSKQFISQIPIQLRGSKTSMNIGSKIPINKSGPITIEQVKYKLKMGYRSFVTQQRQLRKKTLPKKTIKIKSKTKLL